MERRYYIGVDVAQSVDYMAMAVVEKWIEKFLNGRNIEKKITCCLTHLARFKHGVPYQQMVQTTIDIISRPEIDSKPTLVVDATGIGSVVYEMFEDENKARANEGKPTFALKGVKIHGGEKCSYSEGFYRVPQVELVKPFYADYGTERFVIAEDLPDKAEFIKQVQNFRGKQSSSGHMSVGAIAGHDDLVFAVGFATWLIKHKSPDYHGIDAKTGLVKTITYDIDDGPPSNTDSILELERRLK